MFLAHVIFVWMVFPVKRKSEKKKDPGEIVVNMSYWVGFFSAKKNFQGAVGVNFLCPSESRPAISGAPSLWSGRWRRWGAPDGGRGWLPPETSTPLHMDLPFRGINWLHRGWHEATLQGFNTTSWRVLEVIGAILVSIWAGMRFDLVSRDLLAVPCGWYGEPYIDLPQKLLFIDFCSNSEGYFFFSSSCLFFFLAFAK